jgi:hypothetical protein
MSPDLFSLLVALNGGFPIHLTEDGVFPLCGQPTNDGSAMTSDHEWVNCKICQAKE